MSARLRAEYLNEPNLKLRLCVLQFAFVVPLLCEGHEEAFLAFLILEGDHGLFNIIIVSFELLFEVDSLFIQSDSEWS